MLVKTQHNLIPKDVLAHSVVVEDDLKNPIFVAAHLADGIIYASVADDDFKDVLKLVTGADAPTVKHIPKRD